MVKYVPAHGVSAQFLEAWRRDARRRNAPTFFERMGGDSLCQDFARRVFEGVAADAVLRPWFGADLTGWERRLADLLAGYWRGTAVAGDSGLRWEVPAGAHSPESVARWSRLIDSVTGELDLPDPLRSTLRDCFRLVAERLIALPSEEKARSAD